MAKNSFSGVIDLLHIIIQFPTYSIEIFALKLHLLVGRITLHWLGEAAISCSYLQKRTTYIDLAKTQLRFLYNTFTLDQQLGGSSLCKKMQGTPTFAMYYSTTARGGAWTLEFTELSGTS